MTRLYHPRWTQLNGEIGGNTFIDWTQELLPYGSKGVLAGIREVRDAGSSYMPVMAKFLAMCRAGNSDGAVMAGEWEVCPYTGRRRRLKPGYELLAERLGSKDDPRTNEQIRLDIEAYIEAGQTLEASILDQHRTNQ